MRDTHRIAAHPDDGDLVRFLDLQVTPDERRWLFAHLAECGECASRMEALREQSQVLSGLVNALDVVPDEMTRARALSAARKATPARRPAGVPLRVAAMVALAVLVTLGVEPIRAWMVDRWAALVGEDDRPAVTMQPAPVLERGSVISFEPAGETFVLEIEHPQEVGSVVLEVADVSEASAQVMNGQSEEILALPSGLRVANSGASTASYRFTLPAHLRLIQVFAGGRPIAIIPLEDVTFPWSATVSLDAADAAR